jgi:AGZA family xanthine/uracil permease-like MFS transporter
VLVGSLIFWGRWLLERISGSGPLDAPLQRAPFALALPWPSLGWLQALDHIAPYLSLALPFALVTVVGGIDNAESAGAAGDEYRTRDILLTEAVATIVAGICGGVIQNTPYIGHPAYKAMGARAGYTLATGVVIGAGAAVGIVGLLVSLLPEAAVAPILIFIGLSITAQAFVASPARHGLAVAVSLIPAAASVILIIMNGVLGTVGTAAADLTGHARETYATLLVVGNGFVLTALAWATALCCIVDRRLPLAAAVLAAAGVASLFGLMHSPLATGAVFWPWSITNAAPLGLAGAYGVAAAVLLLLSATSANRAGGAEMSPTP